MSKHLNFDEWFLLLVSYYNRYRDTEVNTSFKTFNGYEYNEKGYGLGEWVKKQRYKYKNGRLSNERIKKIKGIDFRFEIKNNDEEW